MENELLNECADGFIDNVANQAQQEEEIKYGVWRVDPDNPNREILELENNPYIQYRDRVVAIEEEINRDTRKEIGTKYVSARDLFNLDISNIPMLVKPFFQKVGLACVAGSSDTGKSTFLRQLALCVAGGLDEFCGFKLDTTHKRAIYISSEDDYYAISYSLKKQATSLGISDDALDRLHYYFETENIVSEIEDRIKENPVDLIVADTFGDLLKGDSNSNSDVRKCLQEYNVLAAKYHCLVIVLHHTGKRTEDTPPSKHNLIGSQAIEGKMRAVIEMRRDISTPSIKHLCVVKGNYLLDDVKESSFVLNMDTQTTVFSNTGRRVTFDDLVLPAEERSQERTERALATMVVGLVSSGIRFKDIAKRVNMEEDYINYLYNKYKDSIK